MLQPLSGMQISQITDTPEDRFPPTYPLQTRLDHKSIKIIAVSFNSHSSHPHDSVEQASLQRPDSPNPTLTRAARVRSLCVSERVVYEIRTSRSEFKFKTDTKYFQCAILL